MLSIFLLLQKNTTKLESLLLIGYSPNKVALPYQLLTVGLNVIVLVLSIGLVSWLRSYYIDSIRILFPQLETGSLWAAISMGILLFIVVSVINILAVKGKCFRFGCTNHRCRIKHITYENKTTFSIHRGLIAFFFGILFCFAPLSGQNVQDTIIAYFNLLEKVPQEKLYLHLDKPFYGAGEKYGSRDIW